MAALAQNKPAELSRIRVCNTARSSLGLLVLLASVALVGCGGEDPGDDGSSSDGGTWTMGGASSGDDSSGGGDGGSGADGATGDDTGDDGGGSGGGGTVDASTRECGPSLHEQECDTGASCTYSAECTEGMCECRDGRWLCSEESTCDDMCPAASETSCGDSCSVDASGCLCRCGGGPDFTSCDCIDGSWQCGTCRGS